ncbi:Uncharacterised protein [Vibrio cholerae]|nr:Uncharacterised protein [Vibrio cholerae]CSD49052.1 Uncharacterised protein [Vibrio cholerae]
MIPHIGHHQIIHNATLGIGEKRITLFANREINNINRNQGF